MPNVCPLDGCTRKRHGVWCKPERECSIDGCVRIAKTRGWCSTHHERWRIHGDPMHQTWTPTCTVTGCECRHLARGMCRMHLDRLRRTGDVKADVPKRRKYEPGLVCEAADCLRLRVKRGYCEPCYRRECMKAAAARSAARRRATIRQVTCEHGVSCVTEQFWRELISGACLYCGSPAQHADHFEPVSRGGKHCRDNLVPACAPCNMSKNARDPWEWWSRRAI